MQPLRLEKKWSVAKSLLLCVSLLAICLIRVGGVYLNIQLSLIVKTHRFILVLVIVLSSLLLAVRFDFPEPVEITFSEDPILFERTPAIIAVLPGMPVDATIIARFVALVDMVLLRSTLKASLALHLTGVLHRLTQPCVTRLIGGFRSRLFSRARPMFIHSDSQNSGHLLLQL